MLRPEGSAGHEILTLAIEVFSILSIVLITVWVLLAYVILRYRRRPEAEASQTKGNLRIEIIWTLIPALIVTVLFVLTVRTTEQIAVPDPRRAVHLRRPPVVVGVRLLAARLQDRQRGLRARRATSCPST